MSSITEAQFNLLSQKLDEWHERVECLENEVEDLRTIIEDLLSTENDLETETQELEDYTDYEDEPWLSEESE